MIKKLSLLTGLFVASLIAISGLFPSAQALSPGQIGPWSTGSNSLPEGLSAPASATYNGYAYIVAGFDSGGPWSDRVYYAKLNTDGTTQPWTSANSLPHTAGYPSAVAYNGYLYVMGGYSAGFLDTVYYAQINSDGSLGAWVTSPNTLPAGVYESAAVAYNDRLYLFGGTQDLVPISDAIYTAPINNDGSVGTWTISSSTLPLGLRRATYGLNNGWVYLVSGSNTDTDYWNGAYYAKLNADGSIGAWSTSPNVLPAGVAGAAGAISGGYYYVMGGEVSSTSSDIVYYAALNADGSLGEWVQSDNLLPQPRQYPVAFAASNFVFVAGGHDGSVSANVFSAFAQPAPPQPDNPQPSPATTSSADTLADTGWPVALLQITAVLVVVATIVIFTRGTKQTE